MKYLITTFFLAGLLAAASSTAQARVTRPHSGLDDPTLLIQLHQQMDRLSESFGKVEDADSSKGVNYEAILKAVQQMEATRRTVSTIIPNKQWIKPLRGLGTQLEKVKQAATQQNHDDLRKSINGLYDSCFRCHSANAPTYD